MARLAVLMGATQHVGGLEVCDDVQLPGATGHYDPQSGGMIRIARSQLSDPISLAATLAHELSHAILLGGRLISPDVPDHERVTDLVPVYLGVGLFAANSTVQEQELTTGTYSGWRAGRQGYLPGRVFGYAMALFAFMREEWYPPWAGSLRDDVSAALTQGLRFLRRRGDSLFGPQTIARPRGTPTAHETIDRLRTGTPTVRASARMGRQGILALWPPALRGRGRSASAPRSGRGARGDRGGRRARRRRTGGAGCRVAAACHDASQGGGAGSRGPRRLGGLGSRGAPQHDPDRVIAALEAAVGDDSAELAAAAAAAVWPASGRWPKNRAAVARGLRRGIFDCNSNLAASAAAGFAHGARPATPPSAILRGRDRETREMLLAELRSGREESASRLAARGRD